MIVIANKDPSEPDRAPNDLTPKPYDADLPRTQASTKRPSMHTKRITKDDNAGGFITSQKHDPRPAPGEHSLEGVPTINKAQKRSPSTQCMRCTHWTRPAVRQKPP